VLYTTSEKRDFERNMTTFWKKLLTFFCQES